MVIATEDRNIISDNSIIEFSFNKSKEADFAGIL